MSKPPARPYKVRTPFQPAVQSVTAADYTDLLRQGLVLETLEAPGDSTEAPTPVRRTRRSEGG